jgi:hypothetical protein
MTLIQVLLFIPIVGLVTLFSYVEFVHKATKECVENIGKDMSEVFARLEALEPNYKPASEAEPVPVLFASDDEEYDHGMRQLVSGYPWGN